MKGPSPASSLTLRVISVEVAPQLNAPVPEQQAAPAQPAVAEPLPPSVISTIYNISADALEKVNEFDRQHQVTSQMNEMAKNLETKVNAFDDEYKISDKIHSTADQINTLDQQYQISPTIISAVNTATTQIQTIDQQYQISQKVGEAVQSAHEQVVALDQQYQISQNVAAATQTTITEGARILSNVSEELRLPERTKDAAEAITYGAQQVGHFLETNETVQNIGSFLTSAFSSLMNPVSPDDQPHITIVHETHYEPVSVQPDNKS